MYHARHSNPVRACVRAVQTDYASKGYEYFGEIANRFLSPQRDA
jgi:hypothetical protein